MALRTLSLFAGVGGLDLGVRLATAGRARTVCYVERDSYAASLLVARMADATVDSAPIHADVCTFDSRAWRGCVDLVIAGFNCQPFSAAGKRRGTDDERWLWPDIVRIIRDTGAAWAFFENVPPIVRHGLPIILRDLAEMGFAAEWGCFKASDVGAPHRRERWFLLAHRDNQHGEERRQSESAAAQHAAIGRNGGDMAYAPIVGVGDSGRQRLGRHGQRACSVNGMDDPEGGGPRCRTASWDRGQPPQSDQSGGMADTRDRLVPLAGRGAEARTGPRSAGSFAVADAQGVGQREPHDETNALANGIGARSLSGVGGNLPYWPYGPGERDRWATVDESAQPAVRRLADGLPAGLDGALRYRPDQLRCLGNAVVPTAAALAFQELAERLALDL